ncbi:TonB-dependent receptor [Brevundimonas terrae]|uniref:TonB-dependent receptor n=1 Tax=Brevundimonas terrae TaxID=363631 RepID=A0ABN0Y8A6_9CAUL|nr:TonB-dependent receptor [Brevundimonas terrae]NIJ28007.1 outer membrane receptor protein involved in Fe transport [Brevundimonas terrae]
MMIAAVPFVASAQSAVASFNIRPAPLSQSLLEFGRQARISIAADQSLTSGLRGRAVSGDMPIEEALSQLLAGTDLSAEFSGPNAVRLVRIGQGDAGGNDQHFGQDLSIQEPTTVADIVVTAQKRRESIQDVPIAVSAFSTESLDAMKIEGGSELFRAVPNVTFSKGNFSMYNFSIRGIGTKAVSASSDPAVAVSFNNTPLIRNRLFEQEYLDVNRVEVLRGPQGTLYGRNATAGVVNMFPNLPGPDFEAMLKAEVGNYGSIRSQMMLNIPLTDSFWVRAAAGMTKRDGFDYNTFNETHVNGRDLHSVRLSAAWEPNDNFRANLIWESFGEDDNRSRTGKQLCTTDPGPTQVGNYTLTSTYLRGILSQGCQPGSLFDDAAYGTPNGIGMAQIWAAANANYGTSRSAGVVSAITAGTNPYAGVVQSRNLREIATSYDPKFRADNDVYQLNVEYDFSPNVTFVSQTSYAKDYFWSTQDYMRYVSNEIFNRSDYNDYYNAFGQPLVIDPSIYNAAPGGVYTDPQLGPSRRMLAVDLSKSENEQFFQEFRLQSNFDGPFDFNFGANYLKFDTKDDYYVFNNVFTLIAEQWYNKVLGPGGLFGSPVAIQCVDGSKNECVYVDRSKIDNIEGDGHNYFRSKNEVTIESYGLFGEAYFKISDTFRLTAGLRYTDDSKTTTPYPTQLLLGTRDSLGYGNLTGGSLARGFEALPDIEQNWSATTGRLVLDWKPSSDLMAYASYARGYKGGGTNPPRAGINPAVVQYLPQSSTFDPEFVNAFEVGVKSNALDGRMRINATAFYYDYSDYQVSQIVDRISLNENFDAESMGLELEVSYQVNSKFRVDGNFGYLKTRLADGSGSIDVMDRTQGNKDWMVLRPWVQVPSNCVAPTSIVEKILSSAYAENLKQLSLQVLCGGSKNYGSFDPTFSGGTPFWALYGITYNPLIDAPNNGRGFLADIGGNELPNAPRWTVSIGAEYVWNLGSSDIVLRGDYYRQAESYFRVYNTEYDKLKGWGNLNVSVNVEMPNNGISVSIYAKNVINDTPVVDAFTNSDDTMLTTNVFTLDPRVIGFNITKVF